MSLTKKLKEMSVENVQELVSVSCGIRNVLQKMNVCIGGNNPSILKRYIKEHNVDISIMNQNRFNQRKNTNQPKWINDLIFTTPNVTRNVIKGYILRNNKLEYKCLCCGNEGYFNNKPLSLHLDHINGINNDNRLENLRFLCPNCHSQTDSYAGKNQKKLHKEKVVKPKVDRKIRKSSQEYPWPSNEELQELLNNFSARKISEKLKVSGAAIGRRAKKMGLILKPRGFWSIK